MNRGSTGEFKTTTTLGEAVRAFVPKPLPPDPPIEIDDARLVLLERATSACARLDGMTTHLGDPGMFLYSYIRREAVLSSQIEGTQSSLSDLLVHELDEIPGTPLDDVREVSNYVRALEHGMTRMKEGFPLSNRLLREIHGELLSGSRGGEKSPGEFRRTQNWIGGTRPGNAAFVPPPPTELSDVLGKLELFIQEHPRTTPTLLRAAMAHVQFETIHPFLDGNGRVGRLLIVLMLHNEGVLQEPMLYLSLYLKKNRSRYYELLDRVRKEGDWEEWIDFFLEGVAETAESAVQTARRLSYLFEADSALAATWGRGAATALLVHRALQRHPIATVHSLAKETGLSFPTVDKYLHRWTHTGIVEEMSGRARGRLFAYRRYLEILSEGTEPL
jgi:Fic family protein